MNTGSLHRHYGLVLVLNLTFFSTFYPLKEISEPSELIDTDNKKKQINKIRFSKKCILSSIQATGDIMCIRGIGIEIELRYNKAT